MYVYWILHSFCLILLAGLYTDTVRAEGSLRFLSVIRSTSAAHPTDVSRVSALFWDGDSAEVLRVAATCRRKPPVGIHALVGCQHGRVIWYLSFILLSFIIFHHLALSFTIFHYLSLSFTIFHDLSWSFIVFLCLSSLSFYLIPTWCDLILSPDIWCVTLWIKLNHAECFERLGMLLLTSFPTWHLDQTVNDLSKTIKCEISAWSCMVLHGTAITAKVHGTKP